MLTAQNHSNSCNKYVNSVDSIDSHKTLYSHFTTSHRAAVASHTTNDRIDVKCTCIRYRVTHTLNWTFFRELIYVNSIALVSITFTYEYKLLLILLYVTIELAQRKQSTIESKRLLNLNSYIQLHFEQVSSPKNYSSLTLFQTTIRSKLNGMSPRKTFNSWFIFLWAPVRLSDHVSCMILRIVI